MPETSNNTLPDGLNKLIIQFLKQRPLPEKRAEFTVALLTPDGSDRLYYRITVADSQSLIAVDGRGTGLKDGQSSTLSQNHSFIHIRNHLAALKFPVPELFSQSQNGDLYLLQDLGDTTLYRIVQEQGWEQTTINLYRDTLTLLLQVQTSAAEKFDPAWCYAGAYYDRQLIIDHELSYFLRAFIIGHCRQTISPASQQGLQAEFKKIAAAATTAPANFFLYRDFQSKNLMLQEGRIFLIDFQGARLGPCYYDLAALINDPYTDIPWPMRREFCRIYFDKLKTTLGNSVPNRETFTCYFNLLSLIRTCQTLGAFAHLSAQGKNHFKEYIEPALKNLYYYLNKLSCRFDLPTFTSLLSRITIAR